MKNLDDLSNLLAFTLVGHLSEFRFIPPLDDNAKIRIDYTKHFFEEAVKGLKSIVKKRRRYHIVKDLNEILESTGHYLGNKGAVQQEREINELIKEFETSLERLNVLEEDPRRFYSEETFKRKNLGYICERLANLYQKKVEAKHTLLYKEQDD